jgi:predicted dienelactone hydrolase
MLWIWFACTDPTTAESDTQNKPQTYDAGFLHFDFVDDRGKELTATVWYPAHKREDSEPDNYEPFQVTLEGYKNAPLAVSKAPLIAFSHGFYAIRYQSAYMMEHLARHGYVSVAVDHPNNVLYDFDDDMTAQVLLERPDDVRFTVNELQELIENPEHLLYDAADCNQYVAMGHSFGSHTVNVLAGGELDYAGLQSFCEQNPGERACGYVDDLASNSLASHGTVDERVIAVIPMSPGLWYTFGEDGSGLSVIKNSLLLAGTEDGVLDYDREAIPTFLQTSSPKYFATFYDTGHYGFSNICDLLPVFTDECTAQGWADVSEVQTYSNQLVLAFIDYHLKGKEMDEVLSSTYWQDNSIVELITD